MAEVILKYSASVYQAKLTKFDSLNDQLNAHLETLEGLRDRIQSYWKSDEATKYITSISRAIVRVKQASDNVAGLRRTYQETMDEMGRAGTAVDDIAGNIDKTVDRAIDVAKVAVDVIPLI